MKKIPLMISHPEIAREWHPTKNGDLTPEQVNKASRKVVWWKCEKGPDHEYEMSISMKRKGQGCPICRGLRVVNSNCLATKYPGIAREWHPTKNGKLTPNDVTAGSHKKVWWKCSSNPDHEWEGVIKNRTVWVGCPFCYLTPQSREELIILFELKHFFKSINPKGEKVKYNNEILSIDIYIPELKLGLEYDGSYWHKGRQTYDIEKTKKLKSLGLEIIRIREQPLKAIFSNDVISIMPFNGKRIVNDLLNTIHSMFKLKNEQKRLIKDYISQDQLMNQVSMGKYIQNLLKEKASKESIRGNKQM